MIDDCSIAALAVFDAADVATMVAIAGSESKYQADARGDALASFSPDAQANYSQYAWEGHLSFGYWQIFLGVHTQLVRNLSGLSRPDELALWLFDGINCARAAREIKASQGFEAWSTYNNAAYRDFVIEASASISRVVGSIFSPPPSSYVAISFDGFKVHLDKADGSFEELEVKDAHIIGTWLRLEVGAKVTP